MSHFYGSLHGSRGEATRCGTKNSGLTTTAASWSGAVQTRLYQNSDGEDCYVVELTPWRGAGVSQVLARGLVGETNRQVADQVL